MSGTPTAKECKKLMKRVQYLNVDVPATETIETSGFLKALKALMAAKRAASTTLPPL
jgi:hypothetical protein